MCLFKFSSWAYGLAVVVALLLSPVALAGRCAPVALSQATQLLHNKQIDFLIAVGQFVPVDRAALTHGGKRVSSWYFEGDAFTADGAMVAPPAHLRIQHVGRVQRGGNLGWPQEGTTYIALIEPFSNPELSVSACGSRLFYANRKNVKALEALFKSNAALGIQSPYHSKTQKPLP